MQINQSVWDYYPQDNSRLYDPLYYPYKKEEKCCKNPVTGEDEACQVYPFKEQGCVGSLVNPNLVRRGWGLDFQLLQPGFTPCPNGWTKDKTTGFCVSNSPEFEGTFYTKDAFVPKFQYHSAYCANPRPNLRVSEFDMRSVNPFTGDYVVYFTSKPNAEPKQIWKTSK